MQPLHEKARPPTDKAVHSPQSDEVTTSCNGFIDLHKDVDKTFYIGCETYTQLYFVAKMLSIKFGHNQSENHFNENVRVYNNSLP